MNKELIFLRTFAISMAIGALLLINTAFTRHGNTRFTKIDVENHPLLPLSCFYKLYERITRQGRKTPEWVNKNNGQHKYLIETDHFSFSTTFALYSCSLIKTPSFRD